MASASSVPIQRTPFPFPGMDPRLGSGVGGLASAYGYSQRPPSSIFGPGYGGSRRSSTPQRQQRQSVAAATLGNSPTMFPYAEGQRQISSVSVPQGLSTAAGTNLAFTEGQRRTSSASVPQGLSLAAGANMGWQLGSLPALRQPQSMRSAMVQPMLAPTPSLQAFVPGGRSIEQVVRQLPTSQITQQVSEGNFEIRPLAEDRIRRVAPVKKGESVPVLADIAEPCIPEPIPNPGPLPIPDIDNVELMQALEDTIPFGTRICVLGGTSFKDEASKAVVEASAAEFSARLASRVVVLTGGMKGVQQTFAEGCVEGPAVVNMLPEGKVSNFGVGVDFASFASLEDRIAVFGQIGDVYISIEGGPGVAKEACAAHNRGAIVIPMKSTGGASGGKFDYPARALECPDFATDEQWELLHTKGMPEVQAKALVDIISNILPP